MDRAESSANRSRCPSLVAGSSIAGRSIGIGVRSGSGRRLLAKWMGSALSQPRGQGHKWRGRQNLFSFLVLLMGTRDERTVLLTGVLFWDC